MIFAVALAAASAGCSTPFGPGPAIAEPPALLSSLPDGPDVALQSLIIDMPAPVAKPAALPRSRRARRAPRERRARAAARPRRTSRPPDPPRPQPRPQPGRA